MWDGHLVQIMSMSSNTTQAVYETASRFSSGSTIVASPSGWDEAMDPSEDPADYPSKQSYVYVDSSRPSLGRTCSELTELSIYSTELQDQHPLSRSNPRDGTTSDRHNQPPPSRFGPAWDSFLETNYGALLVLASQGFGTGMNISARLLETPGAHGEPMHPFQILFARQSITALICTAYGLYTKTIPDFPFGMRGVRWLLVLRGVTGFFGVFGMYFSLLYLPLSEATVLGFLSPVLACYLCSFIMPGETFTAQQQIAAFVSLFGVLFIARPFSLLSSSTTSTQPADGMTSPASKSTVPADSPQEVTQEQHLAAVGIAMIGVFGATCALTIIRVIGTRVHAFISINYFSVWCSFVSLVCLIVFPDVKFRLPGSLLEWSLLAVLGLCGFVMQFLLTAGLAYGGPGKEKEQGQGLTQMGAQKIHDSEAFDHNQTAQVVRTRPKPKASGTRATAMCYTQMLFALAGDKLVFGVTPDTMSWIGSALILAGAVWVAAAKDTASKDKKKKKNLGTSGVQSALKMLRRQTIRKDGGANREEVVGLMAGHADGDEIYDEYDEDVADSGRRNDRDRNEVLESVELRDLRPT